MITIQMILVYLETFKYFRVLTKSNLSGILLYFTSLQWEKKCGHKKKVLLMNTEADAAAKKSRIHVFEKKKKVFRALVWISGPDAQGTPPLSNDEVK